MRFTLLLFFPTHLKIICLSNLAFALQFPNTFERLTDRTKKKNTWILVTFSVGSKRINFEFKNFILLIRIRPHSSSLTIRYHNLPFVVLSLDYLLLNKKYTGGPRFSANSRTHIGKISPKSWFSSQKWTFYKRTQYLRSKMTERMYCE